MWFNYLFCALCVMQSHHERTIRLVREVRTEPTGGTSYITKVDERTILSIDSHSTINLWHRQKGPGLRLLSSLPNKWSFRSFAFNQPSSLFAYSNSNSQPSSLFAYSNSNSQNNIIYFYQITSKNRFKRIKRFTLPFAEGPTMSFGFSLKGALFAFQNFSRGVIHVLVMDRFKNGTTIPFKKHVEHLSFITESLLLAIAENGTASIWDVSKGNAKCIKTFVIGKKDHRLLQVLRIPEKKQVIVYYIPKIGKPVGSVAIACQKGIRTKVRRNVLGSTSDPGMLFLISPSRKYAIIGNSNDQCPVARDGRISVVDLYSQKEVAHFKLKGRPWSGAFLRSDTVFAIGCMDGYVYFFSTE